MKKFIFFILLAFWLTPPRVGTIPKSVKFEGKSSEYQWPLAELNPDLPTDWSDYNFLVLEMRVSTPQRFFVWIYTAEDRCRTVIHPFGQNVWLRAAIPLAFFLEPTRDGHDLASMNNKSTDSFWMGVWGPFGRLNSVRALGVSMLYPIHNPSFELRSVRLAKENPGSAILEKLPVVNEFGQWVHTDWPRKIKNLTQLKKEWIEEDKKLEAGPFNYGQYGGYLNTRAEATGFFRVEQIDGKWWFIDPEGHYFLSTGVNCIHGWGSATRVRGRENYYAALVPDEVFPANAHGRRWGQGAFYTWNLFRRYGSDWPAKWMDTAIRRMDAWGINTIGNWSDRRIWDKQRKAYAVFLSGWGLRTGMMGMPDVFSEEFAQNADSVAARQCAPRKDDPWLLGYFIGNEPPWPGRESTLVDMILAGPVSAIQNEARKFLAEEDTPEGRREFVYNAFKRFLDIVNGAIKKYDPNHLNLGIRFGGEVADDLAKIARVFDVYSLNVYDYKPTEAIHRAYELSGLPVLIGEYHFGTPENGLSAGLVQVKDQRERGVAYRYYIEQAAALPAFIGAHWFQWIDSSVTGRRDGENYNIGFLDVTDRPYHEFIEGVVATHRCLLDVTDRPYYDFIQSVVATHRCLLDVHRGEQAPFNQLPKASEAGTPRSPWAIYE